VNCAIKFLCGVGILTWSVASEAEVCSEVDRLERGIAAGATAAVGTAAAIGSTAAQEAQRAKDGTVRVLHSSGEAILKNKHGQYLKGTFGSASRRTRQVLHKSGQAITKNAGGKYLPGTLTAVKRVAGQAAVQARPYLPSPATRSVVISTGRVVGAAVARHSGTAAAAAGAGISSPVVMATAVVAAGATGVHVYCDAQPRE